MASWAPVYGGGWLADLAVRARVRSPPQGSEKRQEVDPAWPPAPSPLRGVSGCQQ